MSDKPRDLEDRTFLFARDVRSFVKLLPQTIPNRGDIAQIARSSGSVAANYIEANEALSPKDFVHRLKNCRKEAKESRLWLRLLDCESSIPAEKQRQELLAEATELLLIFSAIIKKAGPDGGSENSRSQ